MHGYDELPEDVQKLSKILENSIKKKKNLTMINKNPEKSHEKKTPAKIANKKFTIFPPIKNSDKKNIDKKTNKAQKSQEINNNSSLISQNKRTFLEYASMRNLLDSTEISQINVSIENSGFHQNDKTSFKNVLKNIDKKLKKAQLSAPKLALPKRSSQILINLLDNSESFEKSKSRVFEKHSAKLKNKKILKKNLYEENNSVLNSKESDDNIDSMLAEMRKNVQENVRKKLEVELTIRKKEWEMETKRKIMLEFKNEEIKEKVEKIEEKEKALEKKQELGFFTLGQMFNNIIKF
jgi:hypothetical protein